MFCAEDTLIDAYENPTAYCQLSGMYNYRYIMLIMSCCQALYDFYICLSRDQFVIDLPLCQSIHKIDLTSWEFLRSTKHVQLNPLGFLLIV